MMTTKQLDGLGLVAAYANIREHKKPWEFRKN
jgi:hypothetical protein